MAFKGWRGIFNIEKGQDDDFNDEYDSFDEYDDDFDDVDEVPEVKKSFKDRFTAKSTKKETYNDSDDDDLYDDFKETPVKEQPEKKKKPVPKATESFIKKSSESRVINMSKSNSYSNNSAGQIYMLKPKKIDDAKSAVDALLSGKVVILNLEGIQLDLAQSVTDFISGASYCISGNFSTISQNVFVYTPNGYDLTGAFDEDFAGSSLRDF